MELKREVEMYQQFFLAGQEYARVWKDLVGNLETPNEDEIQEAAMMEIGVNDIAENEAELMIAAFRAGFDSI